MGIEKSRITSVRYIFKIDNRLKINTRLFPLFSLNFTKDGTSRLFLRDMTFITTVTLYNDLYRNAMT